MILPRPNVQRFSDFVGWRASNVGVVTRMEGSALFTQYFSPNFVALPNDRSVCSAVRSNPGLAADVEAELGLKYRGLVKVAGPQRNLRSGGQGAGVAGADTRRDGIGL